MLRFGHWRLLVVLVSTLLPFQTSQSVARDARPASAPAGASRQAKIAATLAMPLLARLSVATPGEKLRVIVRFASTIGAPSPSTGTRRAAAQSLVSHLQRDAQASQSSALSWLQGPIARNEADSARPFWIFNGMALRASPAVIAELAARNDVLTITEDRWLQRIRPIAAANDPVQRVLARALEQPLSTSDAPPDPGAVTWGIARIRADQVWRGLGVTGTGVTVANIDSGVDWNHPALNANYRGRGNGIAVDHLHNWFDATDEGALYPDDADGHGTHTMGTLAGAGGVGVAPGARWMAAKALNREGFGLDSWLHAAFEFLLAPGGDVNMAPDVISNSWGNANGADREFRDDLAALQAAGIFVVFANGNSGPRSGTVGAPASNPGSIGVGATDDDDEVASFSSRGPSPIDGAVKPNLAAPGVKVVSTFPGGAYATLNGTSMATPHVAGVAALILSARPDHGIAQTYAALTRTVVGLSSTLPNNDSGWGRIDAYEAVVSVLTTAALDGYVRDGAQPVPGATVVINDAANGRVLTRTTDGAGYFAFQPLPGIYSVSASAFGYSTAALPPRLLTLSNAVRIDLEIGALASGSVRGTVRSSADGSYVTATVRAIGTPKLSLSNNNCLPCRYALDLPTGAYVLEARANGFRVQTQTVRVSNGALTDADFELEPTLKVAFVDSGAWYYGSAASQYRDAFEQLRWVADEYRIKNVLMDTPNLTTLLRYDAVVWSAPFDSPGIIRAGGVLSDYLRAGRGLLLTGQDVAAYDGGVFGGALYFAARVNARGTTDDADSRAVSGAPDGPLAGLSLTLNGRDSADNLRTPDGVAPFAADFGRVLASYVRNNGGAPGAATLTTPCSPYRAAHFGFGVESIAQTAKRASLIERTLAAMFEAKPAVGIELLPRDDYPRGAAVAQAGERTTHVVRLRNTGAGGVTQRFSLSISGNLWPVALSDSQLTLAPCATALVTATVTIPTGTPRGSADSLTIRAEHESASLVDSQSFNTKTPDGILLVDDDRWFDKEASYLAALAASGNRADHWNSANSTGISRLPTLTELRQYPLVVWYTAYDWFDPITIAEQHMLADYVAGGGRVFFTSQAALAYTGRSPVMRHFFGVDDIDYSDVTSSVVGLQGTALGDGLPSGSMLPFPYNWNLSSAVQPRPGATVLLRGESGQPFALAAADARWRSVFAPFAVETLSARAQAALMDVVISYLSPYGMSTLAVDKRAPTPGESVTLSFAPQLDDLPLPDGESATVSWSASPGLMLLDAPAAITQPALAPLPSRMVNARVDPMVSAGSLLTATVSMTLTRLNLVAHKHVQLRAGGPALTAALTSPNAALTWGKPVTLTFSVTNSGGSSASNVRAQIVLPPGLQIVTDSISSTQPVMDIGPDGFVIAGALAPGQRWEGSFGVHLPRFAVTLPQGFFPNVIVSNGMGDTFSAGRWLVPQQHQFLLLYVARE